MVDLLLRIVLFSVIALPLVGSSRGQGGPRAWHLAFLALTLVAVLVADPVEWGLLRVDGQLFGSFCTQLR